MRKVILIGIGALALAASASAGQSTTSKLVVAMRDPGCHWFYTGGGPANRHYAKTALRHGAVRLVNLDEATLVIKGPGGTRHEKVGASLVLSAKGLYKITMVKQAPDDNHLRLTIK
jgi:hypothetical protein